VYILDKEFDDLLGKVERRENVFYLGKYCIENYLLEERAIVEIALESNPRKTRADHQRDIAFLKFLTDSIRTLDPLFRLFFVVQKLQLGLRNCDCKPEEFSNRARVWTISAAAIASYRAEVLRQAKDLKAIRDDAELARLLKNCFPKKGPEDCNVSGKFLLGMLFHYLRHKVQLGNVSLDSLRYRLAKNCSMIELGGLRRQINGFLKARLKEGAP
jgi:hypothetical protein